MAAKKSVFGSRAEERGFRSIEHTWGREYRVLPQFPGSALFEPDDDIRGTSNLFYKTSVDYVLSTEDGEPLLAIDFDGMSEGFNRGESYIQKIKETGDPHRGDKFNFKLRYAKKNTFPYYIVAAKEFEHLDKETNLTIVDGLIGFELATRDLKKRIPSVVKEHRDYMNNLPFHERSEYVQDIALDVELDSHHKHSPIIQETDKIRKKIATYGGKIFKSKKKYTHTNYPELPDLDGDGYDIFSCSMESLRARLQAMKDMEEVTCTYTIFDTPIGEVSDVAWMRNIGDYSRCLCIITGIAELLVWKKILRLLGRRANWK